MGPQGVTVMSKAKPFCGGAQNKKGSNMKELMLTKAMMTALAVCTVASTALAERLQNSEWQGVQERNSESHRA